MKNNKKIKLFFILLICVAIILIGFIGIFVKKGNTYSNKIKNYQFASDIQGATVLELEVDSSNKTLYFDETGKQLEKDEINDEINYTTKEEPVNAQEDLIEANYKKTIKIMKERLSFLKADQYQLDYDKNTGKIFLTVEDDYISDIESILPREGKLQFIDSTTKDVILDYTDFEKVETQYASLDSGYTVNINFKLNKSGLEKYNNLNNYFITKSEENEEETYNNFKLMFDSEEIAEISYEDISLNGKTLRVIIDKYIKSTTTLQSVLNTNTVISKLSTIGKLPVVYKITAEEYVKTSNLNYIKYIVIGLVSIFVIISIFFVIKYKLKGILATITSLANIAIFLIMIRITNIQISLNGFISLLGLIVLNTILVKNILDNSELDIKDIIKNSYLKSIDPLIVMLLILVVFSFAEMTVISSMGLLLFWGWLTIVIGNIIFTAPILNIAKKK